MSPLRHVAFESSRGEEKTWSLPCQNSLAPTKPSTARPGPGFRVRLRAIESLVEAHVADEALEPRDKVLPGVRIPSRRVYQETRRSEALSGAREPSCAVLVPHLSRSGPPHGNNLAQSDQGSGCDCVNHPWGKRRDIAGPLDE
jgi:hypothetical protein